MGVNSETNIKFLGKQLQEKITKMRSENNEFRNELTNKLETQQDKLATSIRHLGQEIGFQTDVKIGTLDYGHAQRSLVNELITQYPKVKLQISQIEQALTKQHIEINAVQTEYGEMLYYKDITDKELLSIRSELIEMQAVNRVKIDDVKSVMRKSFTMLKEGGLQSQFHCLEVIEQA